MLSGLGKAASVLFSGADPGQGGLLWGLPLQKVAGSGKGNRLCFLSGLGDSMEERVDRFCPPSGDISAFDSAKGGPGRSISVERTPKLARAAAKSLRQRGMTTAGWACAYWACLAGRLWDGEAAFGYIQDAFRTSTANNLMNLAFHCNEWKLHHEEPEIGIVPYQFQMDGNEAIAMAMLLMLLDEDVFISEDGAMQIHLYLLPALPIPRRMLSGAGWGEGRGL